MDNPHLEQIVVYYIDMEDEGELAQFIKKNKPHLLDVQLRDMKELLDYLVMEPELEYQLNKTKDDYALRITRYTNDDLARKIDAYNQKRSVNHTQNGKKGKPPKIEISESGLDLIEMISLDCSRAKGTWQSDVEIAIAEDGHFAREDKRIAWKGEIISAKKPKRLLVRSIAGDETICSLEETK